MNLQQYAKSIHSKLFIVVISQDFNPLSPHNALKHHFTSLKTFNLIFLQLGVLE